MLEDSKGGGSTFHLGSVLFPPRQCPWDSEYLFELEWDLSNIAEIINQPDTIGMHLEFDIETFKMIFFNIMNVAVLWVLSSQVNSQYEIR